MAVIAMSEYRILDLFCGLGGFSQAFEASDRWAVTTVDIEGRFDPDIEADVFDLRPSDFETEFDVVLASPPCTMFSFAASRYERFVDGEPQTPAAKDAVGLVYHTLGLIKALAPDYWFLENPRGHMRRFLGTPTGFVTYCQYGEVYQKPTDLWGNHPPMAYHDCSPGDDCHVASESRDQQGDDHPGNALPRDPAERAKVPQELSEQIRDACEAALDGEVAEQATLEEVDA